MDRRAFFTTTAAAATAATLKAASAASVPPFGQTGAPTPGTEPPVGPLPGSRYPDSHLESAQPAITFGPAGFRAFAGTTAVERVATGFRWAGGPVYFPAWRMVLFSETSAERRSAFVGIHPQLRQIPPRCSRSTAAALAPRCSARIAAT